MRGAERKAPKALVEPDGFPSAVLAEASTPTLFLTASNPSR